MEVYPTAEEEFELMYGDDLDTLQDLEDELYHPEKRAKKNVTTNKETENLSNSLFSSCDTTNKENENTINKSKSALDLISFPQLSQLSQSSSDCSQINNAQTTAVDNNTIESIVSKEANNKKRTYDELFGDIDDLFYDEHNEIDQSQKKQKVDKRDADLALIDFILMMRKANREKKNVDLTSGSHSYNPNYRLRDNVSLQEPNYSCLTVTNHKNQKLFIRYHSELYEEEEMKQIVGNNTYKGIMGSYFEKIWKEAEEIRQKSLQITENNQEVVAQSQPTNNAALCEETRQLWVDLYKPRKYLELLSDESTNRIMLKWIKLWDKVVFHRKPKVKHVEDQTPMDKKNKFKFQRLELSSKLDEHGRPEYKVALLCGPPGLGKTTLAHMVAKHAGYNVVEINASDDRSVESFRTQLEHATQMRSVVDQEQRPNCLIFDEIDGAPSASIEYLVKFINGQTGGSRKSKKSNDKSKTNILKRPIICICNDVYVASLRPLKQIAFVVNFPQTASQRLAERLMEIAKREQIKTDMGAMLALAEKSQNDIRSCLSTLYFFKVEKRPVTLLDIQKINLGQKDMQKGLFSVWDDIFTIERQKFRNVIGAIDTTAAKYRMEKVLHTVTSHGDYEKLAQGIFENYPTCNMKSSSNMKGVCEALEWFSIFDLLQKEIYASQNYSLTPYLQYAFVVWHFQFASMARPKLHYPNTAYEMRVKQARRKAIISEVIRGITPQIGIYIQSLPLILDNLPFILGIIAPPFRPVNLHLFTKDEQILLSIVINIMIDYNLNYIQERSAEGTYNFNLEPNIGEIVLYPDNEGAPKRRILAYSIRQLIAKEIETEKMRRTELQRPRIVKETNGQLQDAPKTLPNHLQTLQVKKVYKPAPAKPVMVKDFFGRIIEKPVSESEKANQQQSNDIWYHYKEGYSNAVRKKIKIASLK